MPLTSSQWQQVENLFSLAMQLPTERRYRWRHHAGSFDVQVGDEVDALIATCDETALLTPLALDCPGPEAAWRLPANDAIAAATPVGSPPRNSTRSRQS